MNTKNRFLDPDCRDYLKERLRANGRRLKPRDAVVLLLRAGLVDGRHHSYVEISVRFGVTHERIRQIEKTALAALELAPDLGPHTDSDALPEHGLIEPNSHTDTGTVGGDLITLVPAGVPLTPAQARTRLLAQEARNGDKLRQLLASWLATLESAHSRSAYLHDLNQYFDYCIDHDLDPLTARIQEFNLFSVWLRLQTTPTGKPYARSTRLRKISAVSSFYQHLVEVDAVDRNPVTSKARFKHKPIPADKTLSPEDTIALIDDAGRGHHTLGPECAALVIELLFTMGVRVSEICNLDIDELSWVEENGRNYRAITFIGKGDKQHIRGIPQELDLERLAPYLSSRPAPATLEDGPALLLTLDGRRLNRHQIARLVSRAARRALGRDDVTPHFGRHTFNRRCEEAGFSVEERQRAMGHASVVTTQGYGLARNNVATDPSHAVAAVLHVARAAQPEGHHHDCRSRPA